MKISYNWLNDIIDTGLSPEKIAELLTGCGLEVEGIIHYESVRGGLEGIVIGLVKTCIKHPNADKLSLTTVDIGKGQDLQIVCGAPNVAAGQKVLVALTGTTVHPTKGDPFEIKKSKIRGEVSEGMICAEDELSLGESHEGILVLPENYEIGKPATDYFPIYKDYVFEIGLTANRGDAASHLGVARDLKVLTGAVIKAGAGKQVIDNQGTSGIQVEIADQISCPRYSGVSISGISVKDSPEWLKNKLKAIGINPINNIVDATNFVLHELGQPLHAFDADKIAGKKIVVRKASAGTRFVTLDKTERVLSGNECMICDAEKPLAIAGVFGGLESGITSSTQNIFIESAYFDPASIRKTARFHGLSTDASFRYERGTDPNVTIIALERVAEIILEIAGGKVSSSITDVYPEKIADTRLSFSVGGLHRLIGQEIPYEEIKRILHALEINIVSENGDLLDLAIPPFRVDVKRQADVAEEILRMYGLNKIGIPEQLKSTLTRSADEDAFLLRNKVADYLSNNGFYEMVSNSLTRSAYYEEGQLAEAVKMLNPLSSDLDIMRMSMLFDGLEAIQYNNNRKVPDFRGFEYGLTYRLIEGKYVETPHLAIFMTGKQQAESWKKPQEEVSYFGLKSWVENTLKRAGLKSFKVEYIQDETVGNLHHLTRLTDKGAILAEFGAVKPDLLKKFDIEKPVYYADIFWNEVKAAASRHKFELEPVSPFPSVRRDLALLLDKPVKYAEIERVALKAEPRLIKNIQAFDVYEGEKIDPGKKSYAVSFILQDEQKTLTDQEIEEVMSKLIKNYTKELGASLRA